MTNQEKLINLGFTDKKILRGCHICQIYSDDEERSDALTAYLCAGLRSSEKTVCFCDRLDTERLRSGLSSEGLSLESVLEEGMLDLRGAEESYFESGVFSPDRMLGALAQHYSEAEEQGFSASRVIGEMLPKVNDVPGGSRLLEYEARVNRLLREYPVTTVCQYNVNHFDGATIMDILKVHPMMVVRGNVVHNPFYIEPEEFLSGY